jgi:hypothetical protein
VFVYLLLPFLILLDNLTGKVASSVIFLSISKKRFLDTPILLLLLILSLFAIFRVLDNPSVFFPEVYLIYCFALWLAILSATKKASLLMSKAFVLAGIVMSIFVIFLALLQLFGVDISDIMGLLRYNEIAMLAVKYSQEELLISLSERIAFGNASGFGMFIFFTYFILVIEKKSNSDYIFLLFLIVLIISMSRTYIVGISLVYFLWASKSQKKAILMLIIPVIVIILVLWYDSISTVFRFSNGFSYDGLRWQLALIVWDALSENGFNLTFGLGYGEMKAIIENEVGFRTTTESAILTGIGSYGFLMSFVIFLLTIIAVKRKVKRVNYRLLSLLLIFIGISFVQPLTEYLFFYISTAVAINLYNPEKGAKIV